MSKAQATPRLPFVLRSPNGQNAGKYLVSADYEGARWTDEASGATRFSVGDAYGTVAACIDMLCQCVVPECVADATEDDCIEFGRLAARDMLDGPQASTVQMFEQKAARRSASQQLFEMPGPFPSTPGYMSVFEWMARAFYRGESVGEPAKAQESP